MRLKRIKNIGRMSYKVSEQDGADAIMFASKLALVPLGGTVRLYLVGSDGYGVGVAYEVV